MSANPRGSDHGPPWAWLPCSPRSVGAVGPADGAWRLRQSRCRLPSHQVPPTGSRSAPAAEFQSRISTSKCWSNPARASFRKAPTASREGACSANDVNGREGVPGWSGA